MNVRGLGVNCFIPEIFWWISSRSRSRTLGQLHYSIFEFDFYFAEIFDHKVKKFGLQGVHETAESKL